MKSRTHIFWCLWCVSHCGEYFTLQLGEGWIEVNQTIRRVELPVTRYTALLTSSCCFKVTVSYDIC